MKVGVGYDAHAFAQGRALVLGGVSVPSDKGLAGHSDADVLCHAIADAVLGAAALGDIGTHFPSSDPRWQSMPSTEFLRQIDSMIIAVGLRVESVDATVLMERPAIGPYRDQMRKNIAAALGCNLEAVNVKATTTDGLGFVGREEGAAAQAVAVLVNRF